MKTRVLLVAASIGVASVACANTATSHLEPAAALTVEIDGARKPRNDAKPIAPSKPRSRRAALSPGVEIALTAVILSGGVAIFTGASFTMRGVPLSR